MTKLGPRETRHFCAQRCNIFLSKYCNPEQDNFDFQPSHNLDNDLYPDGMVAVVGPGTGGEQGRVAGTEK
jgi:hypothetical protein